MAAGFFTFIDKGGKRRRLEILKKNKYMFAAMVAFNWASLQKQIESGEGAVYSLFESEEACELCKGSYEREGRQKTGKGKHTQIADRHYHHILE